MSYVIYELLTHTPFFLFCRPTSDYVYEYRTRWVDDPPKTKWTFPGFPRVSRDKGGFVCSALLYTFVFFPLFL